MNGSVSVSEVQCLFYIFCLIRMYVSVCKMFKVSDTHTITLRNNLVNVKQSEQVNFKPSKLKSGIF